MELIIKAKELAEELLKHPDFEVFLLFCELDNSEYGMTVRRFKINGIGDIGHSDKTLILDSEE